MNTFNAYEDTTRAEAYAKLEFPGTYYLAYRDLPEIISRHAHGKKAIDFGCGTGRSTRFLQNSGFQPVGVDIAEDMIKQAKEINPSGDYRLVGNADLSNLEGNTFDFALSVFTFDNIPVRREKVKILKELGNLLKQNGKIVNLVSSPEIYTHEWASFSTKDFPENKHAKNGDIVKIIITAIDDKRPVQDIVCPHEEYEKIYKEAGFNIVETIKPLAKKNEPYDWVNETQIPPWVIYVLEKAEAGSR